MSGLVGVVAIQGDYAKHIEVVESLGAEAREVRIPGDLACVDRLIIPGGESTTVGKLMARFGLGDAIRAFAAQGGPVWGTCMGLILMAKDVEDYDQYCLGLLSVSVRRNAFGTQVHSFEDKVFFEPLGKDVTGVFIRAPLIVETGSRVNVDALYQGGVV
ncbi:MAG: pyridoxal 5'-phosphate synthase glutaminase subunit PdxT, partial [Chthonomonadaceae bacterium]|nr:pyridoxal 5'-phosphate synthase glutaminase subunit PdxT [Chthonomonadaceae bacterium]